MCLKIWLENARDVDFLYTWLKQAEPVFTHLGRVSSAWNESIAASCIVFFQSTFYLLGYSNPNQSQSAYHCKLALFDGS